MNTKIYFPILVQETIDIRYNEMQMPKNKNIIKKLEEYPKDEKLKNVITYLEKNIAENISFKNLAEYFDISERTLARLFQKELNMSYIQYFTILRMLTSLKLLLDEKLSVNEVALRVGYSSLPTFSNTFNKVIGVRPSEYVKNRNLLL